MESPQYPNIQRKKLVYGGQKGFDAHIARLTAKGWRLVKTNTEVWPNRHHKKIYIAELEK